MNYNQDGRQNGCRLSVGTCGHSTLVIALIFHEWITLFKLSPKFECKFSLMKDNKITRWPSKWLPPVSLHVWTLQPISSKLHIWITFFKVFPKIRWTITKMAAQTVADCQFAHLVICHSISSKFYIWTTFIKLLLMSKYGCCMMNDNQDCQQNEYHLFNAGHYAGPFVWVWLF